MLIGQSLGPFRVEKELGAGAMGAVFLATFAPARDAPEAVLKLAKALPPGQRVAVKVMAPGLGSTNPTAVKRFEREALILKQMRHPHIVRVYAVGKDKGTRYYAMELIDGESLDKVLARRGRMTWEEVVDLGKQLCSALQHAHEAGIVHRDLKPSNLMILRDGTLKLTDFGIAKDLDVTALTSANCTVGTAAYMSPEQCRGERDLTHKSDLYSLGVVFYELVTGCKPFNADNAMEMFMMHVKAEPERPSRRVLDIPIWLDTLICQLLEKSPDQRPRDAGTVGLALAGIQEKVEAQQSAGVDAARSRVIDRQPGQPKPEAEDRTAALSLLGVKVRPRRKKKKPFYEKVWFRASGLLLMLAVVIGTLFVIFRPASPQTLYARAQKLMASPNPEDHEKAMEGPIREYLRRYESLPGEQTDQIKKWSDDYEVEQCQSKVQTYLDRKRRGRDTFQPQDKLEEQAFKAAWDEEEGNLKQAREDWEKLAGENAHRWQLLADRHLEQLRWVENMNARLQNLRKAMESQGKVPRVGDPLEEKAFLAARYDGMGDLARAKSRYEDLKKEAGKSDQRGWSLLAADNVQKLDRRLKDAPEVAGDRKKRIEEKLKEAAPRSEMSPEELRKIKALCFDIIDLYGTEEKDPPKEVRDLQPLVKQARERLERASKLLGD